MDDLSLDRLGGVVPKGYDEDLYRIRHSAAHVLAQAVQDRFSPEGPVHFGIGPPTKQGFYYDFELPRHPDEADLRWIERRMQEIVREGQEFKSWVVSEDEARDLFGSQTYKLELIDRLAGRAGANGSSEPTLAKSESITVYQNGPFVDLCRGPHVKLTSEIDPAALKVLNTAGAYWLGDESRPMLVRVYGTAWRTAKELETYLWQLAEADKRDHRRLGRDMELFHFDPTAPGMPYWLPRGLRILNTLIDFWRQEHESRGYQEIATPLLNDRSLWEKSGHWSHYRENMFVVPLSETTTYAVKPMNCPNAMIVFNLKRRSYRDLPMRLSDCDVLHRNEKSGVLHGLLRVQEFRQDDAHIFLTEDQVAEEYGRILDIAELFYSVFEMKYELHLGTRPSDHIGDPESWDRAETALRGILDKHSGAGNYVVEEGEGAFYGPKVDIMMEDALGRKWQMGTIQLDFHLPRRLGCLYTGADGQLRTPVVIHRVIYGSLERFIGILIEHTAGALPPWLSPIQVALIPVADRHLAEASAVAGKLGERGIRATVDDSQERMGAKIRAAQAQKIPYMIVIGDNEIRDQLVSVRLRTGEELRGVRLDDFVSSVRRVIDTKSVEVRLPVLID